jgi:hypothetical protein
MAGMYLKYLCMYVCFLVCTYIMFVLCMCTYVRCARIGHLHVSTYVVRGNKYVGTYARATCVCAICPYVRIRLNVYKYLRV